MVSIPFPGREVHARVWRIDVGRVPLLVLDTDVDENTAEDRKITDRLYSGSPLHRLEQEMVLGVGGARALASIGWDIELHHLNEGHAGFIVLELLDRVIGDLGFERAIETVKNGLVFTTHTPVPAGIDRFEEDTIGPYLQPWAESWNIPLGPLMELGEDPVHRGTFNMAALCLRSSRTANGVSELHGAVSRKLFAGVGLGDDIGHVTNGVHARTWTATHTQDIFDAALGRGWAVGEAEAWQKVTAIDDDLLSAIRQRSSRILADLVRARTGEVLDPEALIVGFARRFAPYKRASLLLRQPEMLEELLADDNRAVHFVFAGKAHPSDAAGKGLVAELVQATSGELVNGRVTFIPDYEMEIAHAMVQGADVWLNNPIRPREASGTSGEKAVLNGSLNCSVLDGWWAEMYDGENGWEIAVSDSPDPDQRDRASDDRGHRQRVSRRTPHVLGPNPARLGDLGAAGHRGAHAPRLPGPCLPPGLTVSTEDAEDPVDRDVDPVGPVVHLILELVGRLLDDQGVEQAADVNRIGRHDRGACHRLQIAAKKRR
jgi:starch phosphorylase